MKNGELKPAFNKQISTEEQFITHYSIHQSPGYNTTLGEHLESFEKQYNRQSEAVVADSGYGSEENYEILKKGIDAYVKYNYFQKEQKRNQKNNPFLAQNLYCNKEEEFYVCQMGQRMEHMGKGKRISKNGNESDVYYYQTKQCEGCPL